MSKMIEEIESNVQEETQDESLDLATLLSKHGEEIDAFLDLVKAAQESGIFTFLKALFENKGDSMSEISSELVKPQNIRFVRNLMSIYTLLSNIDPDTVRKFMLNLANAVDKSPSMKDKGPMGLMALRSNMKDPDVTVGFRVLFEVAKGFTKPSKKD